MLSITQKALVLGMLAFLNLLVLLFLPWFVIVSLFVTIPFAIAVVVKL